MSNGYSCKVDYFSMENDLRKFKLLPVSKERFWLLEVLSVKMRI
jgi:hypothetical protein